MDVAYSGRVDGEQERHWLRLPVRLPDLTGNWLRLYTIIWAIMLALAIVGPIRSAYLSAGYFTKPVWLPHGFGIQTVPDGLKIAAVTSVDAQRAGVRAGDRIVAIDGWRLPRSAAAGTMARAHAAKTEGSSTLFTFSAPGKAPRDVRLVFSRKHLEETYTNAGLTTAAAGVLIISSNLLIALALVTAAVLLFVRQRRKAVPAFLSLGFLITVAASWGTDWSDLGLSVLIDDTLDLIGWVLIFAALFAFPSGELPSRWTRVAVMILPLLCSLPAISISDFLILPVLGVFFAASAVALRGRYGRVSPGVERQQLRWVFFGFIAGSAMLILDIIWILLSEQLQSTDARWYAWNAFGNYFGVAGVVMIALGLCVSILRYRLYDADAVIGRSAAYGILTLGFVGLFAGSEKLAELIGEHYFEHSIGIAAGAIGAAVAAVCIVPLHNRVHRWAERRFQKALIRLREGLPDCVADLRESASVKTLVAAVLGRVEAGVRSRHEAMLLAEKGKLTVAGARGVSVKAVREWQGSWRLPDGEETLDGNRDDTVFPLRVRLCIESGDARETIGWLLLGPRPDGSFFGKDEREALAHIAGPIARGIHIAQLRERRDAEADKRIGTLEALIAKLASAVGGAAPRVA